jgi:maltose alpha-D-glucosyltransferase/alpha-amylase
LANGSGFEVVYAEKGKYPFAYRRGDYVAFVNPSDKDETIDFSEDVLETLYTIGNVTFKDGKVTVGKSSFTLIRTK